MVLHDSHESSHGEGFLPSIISKKAKILLSRTVLNTKYGCCFSNALIGLWKGVPDSRTQESAFLESVSFLCKISQQPLISTFSMQAKQQVNYSERLEHKRNTGHHPLPSSQGFNVKLFYFPGLSTIMKHYNFYQNESLRSVWANTSSSEVSTKEAKMLDAILQPS